MGWHSLTLIQLSFRIIFMGAQRLPSRTDMCDAEGIRLVVDGVDQLLGVEKKSDLRPRRCLDQVAVQSCRFRSLAYCQGWTYWLERARWGKLEDPSYPCRSGRTTLEHMFQLYLRGFFFYFCRYPVDCFDLEEVSQLLNYEMHHVDAQQTYRDIQLRRDSQSLPGNHTWLISWREVIREMQC